MAVTVGITADTTNMFIESEGNKIGVGEGEQGCVGGAKVYLADRKLNAA